MKYTTIPADLFEKIGKNAGIITDSFDIEKREAGNQLLATTGGINFTDSPEMSDFGEDIDNCPKGMKELNVLNSREIHLTGTGVSISPTLGARLAIASVENGSTHIVPNADISLSDYKDLWFITDYGKVNTGETAGFIAIHLMNTLSVGGFQMQTSDNGKANFAFDFRAYYSMDNQETVPYEIYIVEGGAAA